MEKKQTAVIIVISLFLNLFSGCATTPQQPTITPEDNSVKENVIAQKEPVKDDKKLLGYWGGAVLGAILSQVISFQLILPMGAGKKTEEQLGIIFFGTLLSMVIGIWGGSTIGYNIQDALDGE